MKVGQTWISVLSVMVILIFLHVDALAANDEVHITIPEDSMLHAQQVLEHFDENGESLYMYNELWITEQQSLCVELSESGEVLSSVLNTDGKYIIFDSTKSATKLDYNPTFIVDSPVLTEAYPVAFEVFDQKYAGRDCTVYLLENEDGSEWIKLYLDVDTGFVLFCDAPLFILKTAVCEILPYDASLFTMPTDLTFQ